VLNKIETSVYNILKDLKARFTLQVMIDRYNVDFLVDNKYIIECYGDFWHCNPQRYGPDYYNKSKKKTAKEIWARDKERQERFKSLGYEFLNIWEHDLRNNPKKVRKRVKNFLRGNIT